MGLRPKMKKLTCTWDTGESREATKRDLEQNSIIVLLVCTRPLNVDCEILRIAYRAMASTSHPPPSAVTALINTTATTKSPHESLALEVLHNLQHQHRWTDLKIYTVSSPATPTNSPTRSRRSKSPSSVSIFLISGLPPRHLYIHPDLQKEMLQRNLEVDDLTVQPEWVLPASAGEKWSPKKFAWMFDGMPERETIKLPVSQQTSDADEARESHQGTTDDGAFEWKDAKRVLLGILAHNGMGGDGTITYYIMQEGEVKPRQNG